MVCGCSCHRLKPGEKERHIFPCCDYAYVHIDEIIKMENADKGRVGPTLTELIKGNYAYFDSYRAGFFYYHLHVFMGYGGGVDGPSEYTDIYQFTIPREDFENATLNNREKAITLTKWIRQAMESGTLIKIK